MRIYWRYETSDARDRVNVFVGITYFLSHFSFYLFPSFYQKELYFKVYRIHNMKDDVCASLNGEKDPHHFSIRYIQVVFFFLSMSV